MGLVLFLSFQDVCRIHFIKNMRPKLNSQRKYVPRNLLPSEKTHFEGLSFELDSCNRMNISSSPTSPSFYVQPRLVQLLDLHCE